MDELEKGELIWTWREKIVGEARKAGLREGQRIGRREMLVNLLRGKFGSLPQSMIGYLQNIDDPAALDALGMQLLTAASLDEIVLPDTHFG